MALTQEELQLVSRLKAQGYSNTEIAGYIGGVRLGAPTPGVDKRQMLEQADSPVAETFNDLKDAYLGIGQSLNKAGENIASTYKKSQTGQRNPVLAGFDIAGQIAGGVSGAVGEVAKGVGKALLSEKEEQRVADTLKNAIQPILAKPEVQNLIQNYNALPENTKQNLRTAGNLGMAIVDILTLRGAGAATKTTREALATTGESVLQGAQRAGQAFEKSGVGTVVTDIGRGAAAIPERIATNVAARQAAEAEIKQLPQLAQQAVRGGIEVVDAKVLPDVVKSTGKYGQDLITAVKKFAGGEKGVNPIEVVGKPITESVQALDKIRQSVGAKLGEVAKDLGSFTKQELQPTVLSKLQQINGLEGLKLKKGVLDFADTVLTTADTAGDRKAIQTIFNQAVESGTGRSKHLLRQELFEILGGKKRAAMNLTDTQDKAYQAVRSALSDVLESKNATYKTLSSEYRSVMQPLADIRKMLRASGETATDILDLKGGLLARRLTGLSASNPEIRRVLGAMDTILQKNGKSITSVEQLQELYNMLNKYYDIAPKTGFQSLTSQGVEGALNRSGIINAITRRVGQFTGRTDATRQKALEELLNSLK